MLNLKFLSVFFFFHKMMFPNILNYLSNLLFLYKIYENKKYSVKRVNTSSSLLPKIVFIQVEWSFAQTFRILLTAQLQHSHPRKTTTTSNKRR